MSLNLVPTGKNPPDDINVIIEIPMNSEPVKYEIDKDSGEVFVDRILSTPMRYPCNYGYVPHTLCGDGDPLDVLVMTPMPLVPRCVINCRPIGYLAMKDESGSDEKLIAVPNNKISPLYKNVNSIRELADPILDQIAHFFQHYKDLEKGKWVKIEGWHGPKDAQKAVMASIEKFQSQKKKPNF
ncbi:MAG TPA: inorganic diphosphatase [Nevskiaceae bacterium]|nr:inorganic diphosphatase [Nevskiaceae bacterium]